jgi:D-sedoheptulose 7-phosphate isomerase
MTFPDKKYSNMASFTDDYFEKYAVAAASVDRKKLAEAGDTLEAAYQRGATVHVCGNGGSAGISNHLVCDHLKCIQTDTDLMPRVNSLSANLQVITAIANDISFDECFVYQLRTLAQAGDILVTISSSGDSENVVRAAQWARENNVDVISMTGFTGGRTGELANVHLTVKGDNYGVVEDTHQSMMHILAQYLRQDRMDEATIQKRKF